MTEARKVSTVGILLGNSSSSTQAALIAEKYLECPYCVSYWTAGRTVMGVFSLPCDHKWWLEWVAEDPQGTIGLQRAEVFFSQAIEVQSPWARGDVKPELKRAPCGAECQDCGRYKRECGGCPSTQYYLGREPSNS